jgi:hypothetical protein
MSAEGVKPDRASARATQTRNVSVSAASSRRRLEEGMATVVALRGEAAVSRT